MKRRLLIPVFLLFTLFASSQSIVKFSRFYYLLSDNISGSIIGYKTHFYQADSTLLTFESTNDTISFWVVNYNSYLDDRLSFNSSKHFVNEGLYSLKVKNNIDGEMTYDEYIYVKAQTYTSILQAELIYGLSPRLTAGNSIKALYSSWLVLDTAQLTAIYYLGHNNDTISVDSVRIYNTNSLELNISCPLTSQAGYYHLFVEYGQDTLLSMYNAIFIDNPYRTQIANVSPDSMNNLSFKPIEITIYGNNTHFTNDSNVVYPLSVPFDSLKVINDTLLKAYIRFPIPVKSALYTNENIRVYNPTDGLLQYPIRLDLYSTIKNLVKDYENIWVYPNPTTQFVNIESEEFRNDDISIVIYALSGQKINSLRSKNQRRIQIDVQNFSAGVYFIHLQGSEKQKVLKFIKQ